MRAIAIAIPALFSVMPAFASDWYEGDYQRCAEEDTTVDIVMCVGGLYEEWDARLNGAYRTAIEPLEDERRTQFRDVQRAWIVYRDANCGYYRSGEGTIAAIEGNVCMFALTRDRAEELEMLLGR